MTSYRDELYRLRRERDQALKDAQYYRDLLHDKDQDYINLEDELEQTRQVCWICLLLFVCGQIFSVEGISEKKKDSDVFYFPVNCWVIKFYL